MAREEYIWHIRLGPAMLRVACGNDPFAVRPTDGMPATLVLRPRRRPLAVVTPVLAAGPALVIVGLITHVAAAVYAGALLSFHSAQELLVARRGIVEAWPDGLATRLVRGQTELCWEKVDRLVIVPGTFGRRLAADEFDGHRTMLAAPRSGLLFSDHDFTRDVELLRAMPGGERAHPPVFTAPAAVTKARLAHIGFALALGLALGMAFFA